MWKKLIFKWDKEDGLLKLWSDDEQAEKTN